MESHGNNKSTNDAIGFCLLPSELIQNILLCLAVPEIMSVKSLNKSLSSLISDQDFVRHYNSHSATAASWLFVYKKRWHRDSILHGFTDQSNRWFNIDIASLIKPVIFPDDDVYFLAASGNFFLFVSNVTKQLFSVNLVTKSVKKIPTTPVGPRGTSSWRRPGMKLVTGSSSSSDHFRFMFAELVNNHPVVFAYSSESDTWKSTRGGEVSDPPGESRFNSGDYVFLNVVNNRHESVMIAVGSNLDAPPMITRPRLEVNANETMTTELRVYGGAYLLVIKGSSDDVNREAKVLKSIELLGLGPNGGNWECVSRVPSTLMDVMMKKPYKVMVGCLDGRRDDGNGSIRAVLFSNFEGSSDIIWLTYDMKSSNWSWVPLPDSKMKGLNMAGLAFSSGLTLS